MAKKPLEERIEGAKSFLKENLNTVRAGRANPALLDRVSVNYYGTPTPLKALANISVPDPRTLMISPFDPSRSRISKEPSSRRISGSILQMTAR